VDVDDDAEMKELRRQEERKARARAQEAVRRLQEQGIMDVCGRGGFVKTFPPTCAEIPSATSDDRGCWAAGKR